MVFGASTLPIMFKFGTYLYSSIASAYVTLPSPIRCQIHHILLMMPIFPKKGVLL